MPDDMLKKGTPGLPENADKKLETFKTLIEMTEIISSTLDLDQLMSLVMEKAKSAMNADACSVLLYNRETNKLEFEIAMCNQDATCDTLRKRISLDLGQGIAGWVAVNLKPLFISDVKSDPRFYSEADKLTGFQTESLIAVPLIGRGGLIGVAEILNPGNKEYDQDIFQLLCRQFAIAIENALFYRESIERERLRQELDIASALQKSFLPESSVFTEGALTVSAVNISAAKVGGDVYDFIGPVNSRAGVLIGDVSGKGMSAALYMAKLISEFRYIAHHMDPPEVVMNRMNTILSRSPRGMFLTALYLVVDTATGIVRVSAAGHPPFLWIREDGMDVMQIPAGPPLGIVPMEYPSTEVRLGKGDRLILITDGVFDAKNREGARIGFDTIVAFVREHMHDARLVERLVEHVQDFAEGRERADDLTIVALTWGGAA